ncbi:MAG: hypothetical protein ACYTGL_29120 [Planctomycetota bacterium]|jgi:hypothetical protein
MLSRLIITVGRRMGPNLIPTIPPMVIALTVLAVAFLGAPRLALIAELAWNFLTGIRNHLMVVASAETAEA